MADKSLEDKIKRIGNPSRMLQNAQEGAYAFPIAPQYTNWIEEVRSWRNGARKASRCAETVCSRSA